MPQQFNLDKKNLDKQLDLIDSTRYQLLELAYLHEEMFFTIEELMVDWFSGFSDKEISDLINQANLDGYDEGAIFSWLRHVQYYNLSVPDKEIFILRYHTTFGCCLNSSTYDQEVIKKAIDTAMLGL